MLTLDSSEDKIKPLYLFQGKIWPDVSICYPMIQSGYLKGKIGSLPNFQTLETESRWVKLEDWVFKIFWK